MTALTSQQLRKFGIPVVVKSGQLFDVPPAEQIRLSTEVAVFVSAAGGGAVTAMFLPRGSSIILYDAGGEWLDFRFWNFAAWLRPVWFDVSESRNTKLFMETLQYQLQKSVEFMPALGGGAGK